MNESGKLATALRKRRKVVAVPKSARRISPGLLTAKLPSTDLQEMQRERFERKRKARERRPRATFDAALEKVNGKEARKAGYKGIVENTREFSRIANIPIRVLDLEDVTDLTSIFKKPEGEMTLYPIQSASLYEAHVANGLFAPIPVGEGKTLTGLLMPEAMDSKKTVMLVPPQLRDQLAREIDEAYGPHFNIWTDRIKVIAYSELSLAKNSEILEEEDPDLIVADECFPPDTKITTSEGSMTIAEIVDEGRDPLILSMSPDGELGYRKVVRRLKRPRNKKMVRVVHESGYFECTEDHKIWTERGYVRAKNLHCYDNLCLLQERGNSREERQRNTDDVFEELCCESTLETRVISRGEETKNGEKAGGRQERMSPMQYSLHRQIKQEVLFKEVPAQRRREENGKGSAPDVYNPHQMQTLQEGLFCTQEGKDNSPVLLPILLFQGKQQNRRSKSSCISSDEGVVHNTRGGSLASSDEREQKTNGVFEDELQGLRRIVPVHFKREEGRLQERVLLQSLCVPGRYKGMSRSEERGRRSQGASAHDPKQSYEGPSCTEEDIRGYERENFLIQGRERGTYQTTTTAGRSTSTTNGVPNQNSRGERTIQVSTALLQSRSSDTRIKGSDRGRRADTHYEEMEILRSEERNSPSFSRVERVEVLELGRDGQHGDSRRLHPFVYDLEVADNHNYFAEGVLVSNCHNLRRKESARTKRFMRFMKQNPHCRLVAMSGTMTSRSIMDYAHIIELCLRKNSPLPNDYKELQMWAAALDVRVKVKAKPGALKRFLIPEDKGNIRLGYRRRLSTVQGVITSPGRELGTGLYIQSVRPENGIPEAVQAALDEVKQTWAYNGEEFATPIAFWRFCRQMSSGFYYRWVWPNGVPNEDDIDWLEARAAWHKAVREKLKTAGAGMDSKLLLENCAERWRKKIEDHSQCKGEWNKDGDKDIWYPEACKLYPKSPKHCTGVKKVQTAKDAKLFKCEEFIAWKKVKGRYNPSPPTEAVVIDEFIVHDAIAKAKAHLKKGRKTVIWYVDKIIGELLEKASGFPHYGSGTDASTATDDIIICSIATQGTGKNLQYVYSASITITMPTNGKEMEQKLGRMHRPGQEADTVYDDCYDHTESLNKCMDDCIADAMYIEETNGGRQKLLYADGETIRKKKIMQRKIYESQKDEIAKRLNGESE